VFTFDGESIVVVRHGVVERNAFPKNDLGQGGRARGFEFTAEGQEVWLLTIFTSLSSRHRDGAAHRPHQALVAPENGRC